ncbi:Pirin [Macrophomina phaseolina MS6]|uniref:Pirin n=1 Tax=Macrophomina phaseolina (strain MS6) TaxID=1126212 RepID=K2RZD7_MACPH|nr:Pirin [Macrophomina phaseolina MS6]
MTVPRRIARIVRAVEQDEGFDGRVLRTIGQPGFRNFSPFLMLDHSSTPNPGSFPDHPHRGQETITYLIQGKLQHEDFAGNKGILNSGDLQFMTAGRGIMHAEYPLPAEDSVSEGLQLWVDLPAKLKYCEPRYRDLRAKEIPNLKLDGGKVLVKVISGESHGVESVRELAYTPVWLFDITIQPGGKITQPLPAGYNAFAYTLSGRTSFSGGDPSAASSNAKDAAVVGPHINCVFEQSGECVVASVPSDAEEAGRFVLAAGSPLDQKVVQYGPFVLTTQEEVSQAMRDFRTFSNGFERAKGWQSEISKKVFG